MMQPTQPQPASTQHHCIHCNSTNLSYSDQKQGFGAGKVIVGAVVFGPLGLVAGAINRNKQHVLVRCNDCLQCFSADKMLAGQRQLVKKEQQRQTLAKASAPSLVMTTALISLPLAWLSSSIGGTFGVRYIVIFLLVTVVFFVSRKKARNDKANHNEL